MRAMDALLAVPIKNLEVTFDPEAEIDPTKSYIVAISHKTGLDVPIVVKALGDKLDLAISDQSTHHGPVNVKDPTTISVKLLGEGNFPPISYVQDGAEKRPIFNPSDADEMIKVMQQGKSIVVAAHNPSDKVAVQDINSDDVNPGYMAAMLSQLTGAEILPVLVDIDEQGQGMLGRKDARVFVGKPYTLGADGSMQNMIALSKKRQAGGIPTAAEVVEFRRLATVLRETGRHILNSVAVLDSIDK